MNLFPTLRKIKDASEFEALKSLAATDNHGVVGATHLVVRGNEIVGYAGIGGIVALTVWLDSKRVHARESAVFLNTAECVIANSGGRSILLPCAQDSPFYPFLERLGYTRLGVTTLNVKEL